MFLIQQSLTVCKHRHRVASFYRMCLFAKCYGPEYQRHIRDPWPGAQLMLHAAVSKVKETSCNIGSFRAAAVLILVISPSRTDNPAIASVQASSRYSSKRTRKKCGYVSQRPSKCTNILRGFIASPSRAAPCQSRCHHQPNRGQRNNIKSICRPSSPLSFGSKISGASETLLGLEALCQPQ